MSAVTYCSVPLYEFSENVLANRCEVQKCSSLLIEAKHFLIHVEQYASDHHSDGHFFQMDIFSGWTFFPDGRDVTGLTHTI